MKKCSACGTQFDDTWLACPKCGGKPVADSVESSYHYGGGTTKSTVTREETKSKIEYGYNTVNENFNEYVSYVNEADLPWYLRTWAIVLEFIVFWPVGVIFLIMRITGKGTGAAPKTGKSPITAGKVLKVVGGVLCLLIGVTSMSMVPSAYEAQDVIMDIGMALVFIALGILLIRPKSQGHGRGISKKWAQYEALIDNRGNTKISFIASKLGISEKKAATNIQKMISKGFLRDDANGIGAYINGQYNLVVMTKDGVPFVPVEETMAKEIAAKKAKEKAEEERRAKAEEQRKRENATTIEEKAIYALEDAAAASDDMDVVEYLKRMEKSIKNIVKLNNDDPTNLERKSVKNLRNSYLPSTIELLEKYQKSTTSEDTKAQIKGMFSTLAVAFRNIEKQLKENVDTGTELDIDVMKQTLEREGLLGSDFNIKVD